MGSLREITGDMLKLMIMLEEEPDSEVLKDTLEGMGGELDSKAENYVYVIKEYEIQIEAIKKEKARLDARMKTMENSMNRLKDALKGAMEVTGTKKCGGNIYTITLKNGADQLGEFDESLIPEKYFEKIPATLKLDKRKLLADAKVERIKGVGPLRKTTSLLIK
ncbi:hypothetical protein CB457P1_00074 [Enterocloster phage CB457P1]|jgi:hypothetical protein|nr:hypothetical protein CB457P1_00074 [Enterocloster phage CB457P1]